MQKELWIYYHHLYLAAPSNRIERNCTNLGILIGWDLTCSTIFIDPEIHNVKKLRDAQASVSNKIWNSHKEASRLNDAKKPRYFEHTLGQDMVLWMLFSMLVPAATVICKRGQQRFCWMEQNLVQYYSIFKLHHTNRWMWSFKQPYLREHWCGSTEIHIKKLEVLLHLLMNRTWSTQKCSWSTENNQIVAHFGVPHSVHRSGLWSTVKQSNNCGRFLHKARILPVCEVWRK